jgi:ubiquitin-small subunit ribosomal protein S27Ae
MAEAKGKVKKKKTSKKWEKYEVSGNVLKRKNKSCPKCGSGVFLAEHKDRSTCGKCHYTEFKKSEHKK